MKKYRSIDDKKAWINTKKVDTKEAYENYVNEYPNGMYRNEAKTRFGQTEIEEQKKVREDDIDSWKLAQREDSLTSYRTYLSNYSNGKYTVEANEKIKILLNQKTIKDDDKKFWNKVTLENKNASYTQYLKKFPNGLYTDEARERLNYLEKEEDELWDEVEIMNTAKSYSKYISRYSNGKYIEEAKKKQKDNGIVERHLKKIHQWAEQNNINVALFPQNKNEVDTLEVLNLSGYGLYSIPIDIGIFYNLKELYLKDNFLSNIPFSMQNFRQLEILVLKNNRLSEEPSHLIFLQKLKILDMSDNRLKEFSGTTMGLLIDLHELYLYNNQLKRLPSSMSKINLVSIHIYGNPIEEISLYQKEYFPKLKEVSLPHKLMELDRSNAMQKELDRIGCNVHYL